MIKSFSGQLQLKDNAIPHQSQLSCIFRKCWIPVFTGMPKMNCTLPQFLPSKEGKKYGRISEFTMLP